MKSIFLSIVVLFVFVSYACATPSQLVVAHDRVTWVNTLTNSDGSPIYDLAGTYIYFNAVGEAPSNAKRVRVLGSGRTELLFIDIPGLTDMDVELRATNFDTSDNESSSYSNVAIRDPFGNAGELPGDTTGLAPQR